MIKLDSIEFPSKYLTCYESVLMTILAHQGVTEEARLLGTQACFVFSPADFSVTPKFYSVNEEWHRLYGLEIDFCSVTDEADMHQKMLARLEAGLPVCLPIDLFSLPHTLHFQKLHQHHYVNIFGYENGRFYMVCPYYRFQGWVEAELIYSGFFSPVVSAKGAFLITLPQFTLPPVDSQRIHSLIEQNCHHMLNLAKPDIASDKESQLVGIAGLRTFAQHFQQLADDTDSGKTHQTTYINLSRYMTTMGHSRYWFHKLIEEHQPELLTVSETAVLQNQFADVVQAWKAIGIRLGMGAHGDRPQIIQGVAVNIKKICEQETRLFNTLLGAFPTYEQGTL